MLFLFSLIIKKLKEDKEKIRKEIQEGSDESQYRIAYRLLNDTGNYPRDNTFAFPAIQRSLAEFSNSAPISFQSEIPFYEDKSFDINILHAMSSANTSKEEYQKIWYLGIIMTEQDPDWIMTQVLKSLKFLKCKWKIICPFQLQVKHESNEKIKFGVKLYKITKNNSSEIHLLDLKKISGETFLFFELYRDLLTDLDIALQSNQQKK